MIKNCSASATKIMFNLSNIENMLKMFLSELGSLLLRNLSFYLLFVKYETLFYVNPCVIILAIPLYILSIIANNYI